LARRSFCESGGSGGQFAGLMVALYTLSLVGGLKNSSIGSKERKCNKHNTLEENKSRGKMSMGSIL